MGHSIIVICSHVACHAARVLESSQDVQSIYKFTVGGSTHTIPYLHKHATVPYSTLSRGREYRLCRTTLSPLSLPLLLLPPIDSSVYIHNLRLLPKVLR